MATPIRSDRDWRFDLPADELWRRITSVDRYDDWWPWLRSFDPGNGFVGGATWQCEVAPPLPYVVRFAIHLDVVEDRRRVEARVTGDVEGSARLAIESLTARTSSARLLSELAAKDLRLRVAERLARPVVRWGHDWVLDRGRDQFIARSSE